MTITTKKIDNIYDQETINSKNLFARFSHRTRFKNGLKFIKSRLDLGKVLDYGCGTGVFVSQVNSIKNGIIAGYEPISKQRYQSDLPIYTEYSDIIKQSPYHTITIFQVMEHLQWDEIGRIMKCFDDLLAPDGVIIIEVPIEIGPIVLIKELNRYRQKKAGVYTSKRFWSYNLFEFLCTFIFGIPGKRIDPEKTFMEHKGFDFRELIKFIEQKGWKTKVLCYSPLPIKTWYGNSNVFIQVTRDK